MADFRALAAYRSTAQLSRTPAEASLALHERLYQELAAAKIAYEQSALDRMCLHTNKCMQVLLALSNDLATRSDGPGQRALRGLYLHLFSGIARILRASDRVEEFDRMLHLLRFLCSKMRDEIYLKRNAS